MHTDCGSHFDCEVVNQLTEARGYKHTLCTPNAKWTHGVAERSDLAMWNILKPLCRQLGVEQS